MKHDENLIRVTGAGRLEGFEWGEVDPYVIFTTGRCGSTWLAEMLASTEAGGDPREWLNSDVASYSGALGNSLPEYFSNVVAKYSPGNHFGLEIDPLRVEDTLSLVDWRAMFPSGQTRTFFLYRRDLVAQAWSWVHAEKSGYWHTPDPNDPDDQARPTVLPEHAPTMRELADRVVELRRQEECLSSFFADHGYRPRFIEYEALVADPSGVVTSILSDLGAPSETFEVQAKSKPVPYDDSKAEVLKKFKAFNWPALAMLENDRLKTSSRYLEDHLVSVEPIAAHLVGADSLAEY